MVSVIFCLISCVAPSKRPANTSGICRPANFLKSGCARPFGPVPKNPLFLNSSHSCSSCSRPASTSAVYSGSPAGPAVVTSLGFGRSFGVRNGVFVSAIDGIRWLGAVSAAAVGCVAGAVPVVGSVVSFHRASVPGRDDAASSGAGGWLVDA